MPIYEYKCNVCGYRFEKLQTFHDEPVKVCPKCKGEVKRLISKSSFILKGSGWYVTDYARKNGKNIASSNTDKSSSSSCSSCSSKNCSSCKG